MAEAACDEPSCSSPVGPSSGAGASFDGEAAAVASNADGPLPVPAFRSILNLGMAALRYLVFVGWARPSHYPVATHIVWKLSLLLNHVPTLAGWAADFMSSREGLMQGLLLHSNAAVRRMAAFLVSRTARALQACFVDEMQQDEKFLV